MGIALLLVATPRLRAAFIQLPVSLEINKLRKQQPLVQHQVLDAIKTSQTSLTLLNNPHDWQNLGELSFYYGKSYKTNSSIYLNISLIAMQESLRLSPANSDSWFSLAVANKLLNKPVLFDALSGVIE